MFGQVHYPVSIFPEELDDYLNKGWFRMGQTIFTTSFLYFKGVMYDAIWLRVELQDWKRESTFLKLHKLNSKFRVHIQPATFTQEKESLYQKYKSSMAFEPSASIQDLLFGQDSSDIYNTWEVCLYDFNRLIAVGFFDLGKSSAAGISSFYDPEYKKYSLGKYLIYLKLDHAQSLGMRYFYPGYFAPGYRLFDYKLEIGKSNLEFFNIKNQSWNSITDFHYKESPLSIITKEIEKLKNKLHELGVDCQVQTYEFFNSNLVPEFHELELFDVPKFLTFYEITKNTFPPIAVYNIFNQTFQLIQCKSLYALETSHTPEGNYSQHLLKEEQVLVETKSITEMAEKIIFLNFVLENMGQTPDLE
jgi:arginine-tRNA-protein transferase